ncbi:MAG TPA: HAD-IIIA family hydrolase, partial [archaeon]|nr:HAD-IIIA family hydrolase [archaeon]
KLAEPFFKGEKDFLCVFADLMMKLDCRKMLDFHAKKQALATFLAHESDHPWDSDLIVADEAGRVREMPGKLGKGAPLPTNLTKSSVYAFNSKIFKHMPAGKFDLDKDVLKKIVAEGGKNVYAYHSEEFVKDMGTPERYEKMQRQWPSIWNNGRIGRKAVFLDRDGTIIEEANLLTKYEQVKYIPGVFEAVKKLNDAGFAVVIVSNQPVVARNLATEKQVLEVQERINKDFGERGAELDAFYYCPHHPEKHHADGNPAYRMECECRKPKPGMLLKAAERLGIDLESSWMVGDQNRDVAAGKRVGCKAILVGTGYAGKQAGTDKKEGFEPDFSAKDLPAAVELILKRTSK